MKTLWSTQAWKAVFHDPFAFVLLVWLFLFLMTGTFFVLSD
ncbi:MAG TPA: hypothetical protein VNQ79_04960 [Blastocatellia bacterium]|nr:hypothetical protein [Blastocatellia bacterium]